MNNSIHANTDGTVTLFGVTFPLEGTIPNNIYAAANKLYTAKMLEQVKRAAHNHGEKWETHEVMQAITQVSNFQALSLLLGRTVPTTISRIQSLYDSGVLHTFAGHMSSEPSTTTVKNDCKAESHKPVSRTKLLPLLDSLLAEAGDIHFYRIEVTAHTNFTHIFKSPDKFEVGDDVLLPTPGGVTVNVGVIEEVIEQPAVYPTTGIPFVIGAYPVSTHAQDESDAMDALVRAKRRQMSVAGITALLGAELSASTVALVSTESKRTLYTRLTSMFSRTLTIK